MLIGKETARMSIIIAYVLVIPLVQFCLTAGTFLAGFPVALLLAWAPTSLRTKIAGVVGGIAGVALAVAFGYGVFHFVVGPESFTVGAFIASTLPLILPIRNDYRQSRQVEIARQQLLENLQESRSPEVVNMMTEETHTAHSSNVVGQIAGLILATLWYFIG